MATTQKPPRAFDEFSEVFPRLRDAWDIMGDASSEGPLDEKTQRLIKLGIAIGAMREGAVHASARKALGMGITVDELHQVVALAAGTIGLPSTVAVYTWIRDVRELGPAKKGRGKKKAVAKLR
ncbi:MAG: carboxymuconolactone decarboxylase family protein [Thermoanaerobaculia bacterium]|jgi:alkylhydroperoxidase/carboxymuconolactone decarboxylase family protein YurZ